MKRFKYRLEQLLNIRASEELEQARVLGMALQREEAERLRVAEVRAYRDAARRQVEALPAKPLNPCRVRTTPPCGTA